MGKRYTGEKPRNIYQCISYAKERSVKVPPPKPSTIKPRPVDLDLTDRVKELFQYANSPEEVDILADTYKKLKNI